MSPAVEDAFRTVPRHAFVPNTPMESAYADQVVRLKEDEGVLISSMSQPGMIAQMLEQLRLQPAQRVLEIGTGSGYTAALLAAIVGPQGFVTTVDLEADLTQHAQSRFDELHYRNVQAIAGDGTFGYSANAPYDRILLTVCAADIEAAWWNQLNSQGIIVLPLSLKGAQKSIAFQRTGDTLQSASMVDCGFVTARGHAKREEARRIAMSPEVYLFFESGLEVDLPAIARRLLDEPLKTLHPGRRPAAGTIDAAALLWIGTHDQRFCRIDARGEGASRLPSLFAQWYTRSSAGLVLNDSIALLDTHVAALGNTYVVINQYGPDLSLGERMLELFDEWENRGRPGRHGMTIHAVRNRLGTKPVVQKTQLVMDAGETTFLIDLL